MNDERQAVLADFGLTRIDHSFFGDINSTVQSGHARWTAPELSLWSLPQDLQSTCGVPFYNVLKPRKESDIWSFGMTCLEIMTEKPPFSHLCQEGAVIMALYKGERPALPVDTPVGSDALWTLAEQCWKPDPRSRPTASDILKHLQDLP